LNGPTYEQPVLTVHVSSRCAPSRPIRLDPFRNPEQNDFLAIPSLAKKDCITEANRVAQQHQGALFGRLPGGSEGLL
jgi:hypothetical protein